MTDAPVTLTLPSSGGSGTPPAALAALAGVMVLALGCLLAVPFAAPLQPSWAWLLGAVGVAVALWVVDVLVTLLTRGGRLRLRLVAGATEVVGSPGSRLVDLAAPLVFVGALVGGALSLVDTDPSASGTTDLDAAAPVAVLALLALMSFLGLLGVLRRTRLRSRLRLHVGGLEVSGPSGRGDFEWDALTRVRPTPLAVLSIAGSWVPLPGAELRSDPVLVARLVEHYRAHPRDRSELTDGRAIDRAREDRLAPHPGSG